MSPTISAIFTDGFPSFKSAFSPRLISEHAHAKGLWVISHDGGQFQRGDLSIERKFSALYTDY